MEYRTYNYTCDCGRHHGVLIPEVPNPIGKAHVGLDCKCGLFPVITPTAFRADGGWDYDVLVVRPASKKRKYSFPIK